MKPITVRKITTHQKIESVTGKFSIRTLQELMNENDMVHDLHRHEFYFVLAVKKGKGIHDIDFTRYHVHDHTVFILRPGQVHRLELKTGASGFLMEFDPAFYMPKNTIAGYHWKKATGKNYCEMEATRFMKLHNTLTNIYYEYTEKQEAFTEAIKAILELFFIEYIRQSRSHQTIPNPKSSYTQERFEEFMHMLETQISSKKNVSQYAGHLHLSSYQLNAITKASAGKTVSELINEQIILEAKRLLIATSSLVSQVADILGYEDPSYFIRFFKKHTGFSPEVFRQKLN